MRVAHPFSVSRPSLQPLSYLLVAFGFALFGFVVVTNPVAVALPIGGTVAATAMVWCIDKILSLNPVGVVDPDGTGRTND